LTNSTPGKSPDRKTGGKDPSKHRREKKTVDRVIVSPEGVFWDHGEKKKGPSWDTKGEKKKGLLEKNTSCRRRHLKKSACGAQKKKRERQGKIG